MRKHILTALAVFLIGTIAVGAGKLQDSDFASSAEITGAGGSNSQLLNTSKIWDNVNAQLLNTTLAGFQAAGDYLLDDGTTPLTANWDVGAFDITAQTFIGALNGNASTATALAANPTDCGVGEFANAIDASGNLTCATVDSSPLTTKGDIYTYDTANARLPVGTNGQVLSANSATATGLEWIAAPSGDAITKSINQTTHGFSVGDLVRLSGAGTYTESQADSAANAEVEGMVSAVADADNFTLMMKGYVAGLSGLTANTRYFLDASTAGAMTDTPPSTADQVVKYVFVADSTTSGYVDIQPGRVVESQASEEALNRGLIGEAYIPTTNLCFPLTTSASWSDLTDDTDCPGPTVAENPGPGTIQTTDADNIEFTVNDLEAGTYKATIAFTARQSTTPLCGYRVSDGTTSSSVHLNSQTNNIPFSPYLVVQYAATGNRTFRLQAISDGANNCGVQMESSGARAAFLLERIGD